MYVCLYVCLLVCMYVCLYACMPVCLYVCVCVYVCTYVRMHVCTYVRMYVCTYVRMYVRMYVCTYVPMYLCMYAGGYVCMYRGGADVCPKSTEFHVGPRSAVLFPCVFFAHCEHANYWYCMRLVAFLRLPKTVSKSPFEAYRNLQRFEPLTETSTNRKTLKEHQWPNPK